MHAGVAGFSRAVRATACGRMPAAMSFFVRIFVAWLIVAALPLQGFAAASMLLCSQPAAVVHEDASEHGHHAGHAHDHGADMTAVGDAGPDASLAAQPHEAHAAASTAATADDPGHSCSICASCCHVMGFAETVGPLLPAAAPSAALGHPGAPVTTRASPLPDKPPRA